MTECQRCGKKHRDPYLHCSFCRRIARIRNTKWIAAQLEAGLCAVCVESQASWSRYRCTHHLEVNAAYRAAQYADQRKRGLCGYGRCLTKSKDAAFCEVHAEMKRAYQAKWEARKARLLKKAA